VYGSNGIIKDDMFKKEKFIYNKEKDVYICPNNRELKRLRRSKNEKGKINIVYQCKKCQDCPYKEKCMTSKTGRSINRWEHEEILESMKGKPKVNAEFGLTAIAYNIKRAINIKGIDNLMQAIG
jgi:hypothetical protein